MTTENKPTAPLSAEELDKQRAMHDWYWALEKKGIHTTLGERNAFQEGFSAALITQARAAPQAPQASVEDARDAARFEWQERNRTWRTRYRIKPGRDLEWQMTNDGEPWGEWGDLRKVFDAAMSATQEGK